MWVESILWMHCGTFRILVYYYFINLGYANSNLAYYLGWIVYKLRRRDSLFYPEVNVCVWSEGKWYWDLSFCRSVRLQKWIQRLMIYCLCDFRVMWVGRGFWWISGVHLLKPDWCVLFLDLTASKHTFTSWVRP